MIKIENVEVCGWEVAIRGMRNPMNSWDKSDSCFCPDEPICEGNCTVYVGQNDHDLMMKLVAGGSVNAKFRRMLIVTCDITAPLYWWKEFDTYKIGTVANSCSTMHKIHAKPFELGDFSHEQLSEWSMKHLASTVELLNHYRNDYLNQESNTLLVDHLTAKKHYWWQMIQLLPSSYNQRRTVQMNYEMLANVMDWRQDHKLDEWREFCRWVKTLPYSEIITGESK